MQHPAFIEILEIKDKRPLLTVEISKIKRCITKMMKDGKITLIFSEGEKHLKNCESSVNTHFSTDLRLGERIIQESLLTLYISRTKEYNLKAFINKMK